MFALTEKLALYFPINSSIAASIPYYMHSCNGPLSGLLSG